jgi:prepilin-type N-terminal cleavage/methylation domain-containing protein
MAPTVLVSRSIPHIQEIRMSKNRSGRRGFTLAEVLVTVAIVAILAAVVVPAVTNQISKGDEANIASSAGSVRTGITAFVSDTRRFPGRVSDLFNAIVLTDVDIKAVAYGAPTAAKWKGPYMAGSLAVADSMPLGLGFMRNTLKDSGYAAVTSGYVIATISGVYTDAAAQHIDSLIDNGNGRTAGTVQWRAPVTGQVPDSSLKLLLMGSR